MGLLLFIRPMPKNDENWVYNVIKSKIKTEVPQMIDQETVAKVKATIAKLRSENTPQSGIRSNVNIPSKTYGALVEADGLLGRIQELGEKITIDTSTDEISQLKKIVSLKKMYDEEFLKFNKLSDILNDSTKIDINNIYIQISNNLKNLAKERGVDNIENIYSKIDEIKKKTAQATTDFNALKTYLNNHVIDTKSKSPAMIDLRDFLGKMENEYTQPISDAKRNKLLSDLINKIQIVQLYSQNNFRLSISRLKLFVQRRSRTDIGAANALKVINYYMGKKEEVDEKKGVDGKKEVEGKKVDVHTAIEMVNKDGEKRLNINVGNKTFKR